MLLFVYGSLRRGQQHHDQLRDARFVHDARTEACYELVRVDAYPALVEGGSTAVSGELYEVDAQLLAALDEFEEAPAVYQRQPLRIAEPAGVRAEGYVMAADRARDAARIPSGDWSKR
jgi:gamma-glutamylcyclotransferase (GGCT)/AIG2-like uncharacterized protein YtfP